MDKLQNLLQRVKTTMSEEDYQDLKLFADSYVCLTGLVEDKNMSIHRLRKLLFGSTTEKTREVIKDNSKENASDQDDSPSAPLPRAKPPPKGHGRNGAKAYAKAETISVSHDCLTSGDPCPDCKQGTVYEQATPGILVRIVGQAPLQAMVYELQKHRCNLCGKVFTAPAPAGVGSKKYDATAASMIALLKYGCGLPFNRLQGLQESLGIPLPASTQWDIVYTTAGQVAPAYDELIRHAAQGEVLYNDDTTMKILELMGKRAKRKALAGEDAPKRKGIFTSGIVSAGGGQRIALFFTGRRHAGENLAKVLAERCSELTAPIQMCDALSRNMSGEFKTILSHCLAHGRRNFVDVVERFPEQCRYVLETLAKVYENDAEARERNLSAQQRLEFHQAESGPLMKELNTWLTGQLEERQAEPNSGLGQAITYMLKHWDKLTLFLREPGAPLDNNICERALKKAILHRKNSMFYKSERGARTGDIFMSLIYTCQLCSADPFAYLTAIQENDTEVSSNPQNWLPWNYHAQPQAAATPFDNA